MAQNDNIESRLAEQRARIVQLEADGDPDDLGMAWTMMEELLAEAQQRVQQVKSTR